MVGTPVCLQKWLNRSSLVWKSRPMKPRIRWDIGSHIGATWRLRMTDLYAAANWQCGVMLHFTLTTCSVLQHCDAFFLFCAILHRNMNTNGRIAPIWKIFAMQARHSSPWQLGHVHVLSQPVRQLLITVMSPDELICRSS